MEPYYLFIYALFTSFFFSYIVVTAITLIRFEIEFYFVFYFLATICKLYLFKIYIVSFMLKVFFFSLLLSSSLFYYFHFWQWKGISSAKMPSSFRINKTDVNPMLRENASAVGYLPGEVKKEFGENVARWLCFAGASIHKPLLWSFGS